MTTLAAVTMEKENNPALPPNSLRLFGFDIQGIPTEPQPKKRSWLSLSCGDHDLDRDEKQETETTGVKKRKQNSQTTNNNKPCSSSNTNGDRESVITSDDDEHNLGVVVDAQPLRYYNPIIHEADPVEYVPPKLTPKQLRDHIVYNLGGTELKVIIKKPLTETDTKNHYGKISLPRSKILQEFLKDDEKAWLHAESKVKGHQNTLEVPVVASTGKVYHLGLAKYGYSSKKKKSNADNNVDEGQNQQKQRASAGPGWSYVLNSKWNNLKDDCKLKQGQDVHVWSFRNKRDQKLCFAIAEI